MWCIRVLSVVASLRFLVTAQGHNGPTWPCPFQKCERCPTTAEIRSPGIGFALEMGYGTAAIKYDDGTHDTVAMILGPESYISTMQELTQPANFTPDGKRIPNGTPWKDWALWRAKRRMNKILGRPATPQVASLSAMVLQLREAAQVRLGVQVKAAVLSQPNNVIITQEEVEDVFDYVEVKNLMPDELDPLFSQLFATSAAYAGYGKGLCRNYTDVYGCETEEYFFPANWTLFVDYSQEGLSGSFGHAQSARMSYVRRNFVELSLGLRHMPGYKDEGEYWAKVTNRIREFIKFNRQDVQDLVLTGESVSDQRFQTALRNALLEFSSGQGSFALEGKEDSEILNQIHQLDFLFATANGAAEFAKRRLEGMARCLLPEKCRGSRRSENGSAESKEL